MDLLNTIQSEEQYEMDFNITQQMALGAAPHVFHHQTQSFFPEAAGDLWERSLSAIESFDQNNSELENLVGRIRIQEEEYVRRNKLVRFALAAALTLLVLGFLVLVIASWSTAHNDDDSNGGGEPGENIPVIHYHPRIRG